MLYSVIYSDKLCLKGRGAWTPAPFIIIRPRYKGDIGLLEHERIHVKQFWRNPFTFHLKYLLSPEYRLECEVEAYKKQLMCSPGMERRYANFIANKYSIPIGTEEAYELLKEG